MINLTKLKEATVQAGKRIAKLVRYGNSDVVTANDVVPFGIDSGVPAGYIAVYAEVKNKQERVVVGYLNINALCAAGESRLYSTNSEGDSISTYVMLRTDGSMELGGSAYNATRYQEVETAYNELKETVNNLVQAFNSHIHATPAGASVAPTAVPGVIPATPSSGDITPAKSDNIKMM